MFQVEEVLWIQRVCVSIKISYRSSKHMVKSTWLYVLCLGKNVNWVLLLCFFVQELNRMLHCITMISLRLLRMNTEDGSTAKSWIQHFLATTFFIVIESLIKLKCMVYIALCDFFYGSGDFTAFGDVCFKEFGNAVKFWSTINEPNIVAWVGYDLGSGPPSHCSPPFGMVNCSKGNSSTEPYIALHNMLLAHASTARLYKQKYKASVIHTYISMVPWIARYDSLSFLRSTV